MADFVESWGEWWLTICEERGKVKAIQKEDFHGE
jgi:hypothetical protein